MNIQRLPEILPHEVATQVASRWDAWRRQRGDTGETTFFAALHREGVINSSQLGDLLGNLEVDVTMSAAMREPGRRGAPAAPAGPRYDLVGLLGRGAMGEVHIARDTLLNRNVAFKMMDPSVAADPGLAERFLIEAQVTAQLDHPSIIPVYALDIDRGRQAYAMKLIRGQTLEDYIHATKAFYDRSAQPDADHGLDARLELFVQVCNAVHYAHTRGVVHRDLKPENVMVGAFHEVIVMDWGIAKILGRSEHLSPAQVAEGRGNETQVGFIVGTPRYMSPEQAEGRNDEIAPTSDQYSLGLILYELVTLTYARDAKNAIEMIFAAEANVLRPFRPYKRAPAPRELKAIYEKATQLDPARRYGSVKALADDVRRYMRDEEVRARPDSLLQKAQRWISHHRDKTLMGVLGLVVMVFVVGAVGLAGAIGAVEYNRWEAAKREAALGEYLTVVQRQARRLDNEFLTYGGLLTGLAMAGEEALAGPVVPRPYYMADAYFDPTRAPSDLVSSSVYKVPISVEHPDVVLAPGVEERRVQDVIYRLAGLQPAFFRVLLESHGPEARDLDAKRRAGLIRTRGVPLTWAYVATDEGILVGYPGVGEYPNGYDPRVQDWYRLVQDTRAMRWTASLDESGQGLLLTGARAIFDVEGRRRGVAAIDMNFKHLVDELLLPADIPVDLEAWVVDDEGNAVVSSALKDRATRLRTYRPRPFPHAEVLDAAREDALLPSLELDVDGDTYLFAWSRLQAVDYLYVVAAKTSDLVR